MKATVQKKEHEYVLTKGEIKYKVMMNPNKEKYNEIKKSLAANGHYCPCSVVKSPDTRCQCKEFRDLDKENVYCSCGLYFKVLRTPEEMKNYAISKPLHSKNEKKILREKDPKEPEDEMGQGFHGEMSHPYEDDSEDN
jgi:hypothetical protein